jgi:hypothetical protein
VAIDLIPEGCIALLPLSPQPVAEWSDDSDVAKFLVRLFDIDSHATDENGQALTVNYKTYGISLFQEGRQRFIREAGEFRGVALDHQNSPIPEFEVRIDDVIDFTRDTAFGLMAKYAVVWDAILDTILSDGAFFSLAHTLEVRTELDCSMLLAKQLYYKQALQTLRGLLELSVLHVAFAANASSYEAWQNGDYRIPSLRGKNGLLKTLVGEKVLTSDVATRVGDLYEQLNGTIHSTEGKMIHTGLDKGRWAGLQFKSDQHHDWCNFVAQTLSVCIDLLIVVVKGTSKPRIET